MPMQNIYDNETFFEGYKQVRENKANENNLFEKPALFSLLPDLRGLKILDLGCGYGENCLEFVNRGAEKVVGVEISKKMLEVAMAENANPKIKYKNMPMEEIAVFGESGEKFDLVVSSLALHYVEDFAGVVKNVHSLLCDGGLFVFSQEHPLATCHSTGERWTRNERGEKIYANISNYSVDGERKSTWFVDGVERYHRTFSTITNTLIDGGFEIQKLIEPVPTNEIQKTYPYYADLFHKPNFLLAKTRRK